MPRKSKKRMLLDDLESELQQFVGTIGMDDEDRRNTMFETILLSFDSSNESQ